MLRYGGLKKNQAQGAQAQEGPSSNRTRKEEVGEADCGGEVRACKEDERGEMEEDATQGGLIPLNCNRRCNHERGFEGTHRGVVAMLSGLDGTGGDVVASPLAD